MVKITNYEQFIELVEKFKIVPFSEVIPEYPSLTVAASDNQWHTENESDPWTWRTRIVQDDLAAYGKFFGSKVIFVHKPLFPSVKKILTTGKTVEERYQDGLLSRTANHIYSVIHEQGSIDSRNLRKVSGLHVREDKKEYERALVELQNFGDIVITGAAKQNGNEASWSSMCYQTSDAWLEVHQDNNQSVEDAKAIVLHEIRNTCTPKALKFFDKKLDLQVE